MDYSHNFSTRNIGPSISPLSSTALPDPLGVMDQVHLDVPPVPTTSTPLMKRESLFDQFGQGEDTKEDAKVYLLSQVFIEVV